jgi:hypothetical protein
MSEVNETKPTVYVCAEDSEIRERVRVAAAHDRAYARGQTKVLINITGPALSAALKNLRMLEKA